MEDKQIVTLWAVGATILSIALFFAWTNANNKLNTASSSGDYSIEDVLYEAEHNYEITRQIVRDYNLLSSNAQDECDVVTEYFGDDAGSLCLDTIFSGPPMEKTMSDIQDKAIKGMRAQLKSVSNGSEND